MKYHSEVGDKMISAEERNPAVPLLIAAITMLSMDLVCLTLVFFSTPNGETVLGWVNVEVDWDAISPILHENWYWFAIGGWYFVAYFVVIFSTRGEMGKAILAVKEATGEKAKKQADNDLSGTIACRFFLWLFSPVIAAVGLLIYLFSIGVKKPESLPKDEGVRSDE